MHRFRYASFAIIPHFIPAITGKRAIHPFIFGPVFVCVFI